MVSRGVIKGFEDGTFKPDQSITRAEFTSIFMRTLCLGKVKADNKYSDVNSSAWYYNDVVTATELGLVEGIGQGKFDPNRNITRQEMSAVVSRFLAKAKLYPIPSETDVIPILDNFLDGKNVSDWAKTNVVHAIKAGLVKGNGNKIQPKKSATRGEVTALFSRMLTNLLSK
ncbi:S-layer homology domain-containing protein [Paenibacillus melissococcoides]|uniref:S-layer homology domain-containing protein n=2 Tax=Paenibacillus TaxID=44249 RepID=A0ABM9GBV8_9BACL|nr:S-layer homology domain-containing protein [Paenibacillus melissococcoides]CAH8721066.1 S-layer homology domain-containing protein [Paenibacillus melissococcoides]